MTPSHITSTRRLLGAIAAVSLAAGALAACGPEDSAEFDPAEQAQETTEETEQQPDEASTGDDDDEASESDGRDRSGPQGDTEEADEAGGAGDESGADYVRGPEDAVETVTYDLADREMEVTVGLHSLRVEGEVMLLELSFTPEGGRDSTYGLRHFSQGRGVEPLLNDRENLKQYSVLRSGGDRWASPSGVTGMDVESGQTLMFYAYYAAPEDDIDTITISVIDGLAEFEDAEIEW